MTRRLRENREDLEELVDEVARRTGIPFTQVEKDFWLTEALRGVVQAAEERNLPVYFKGGTSLSKVYGIIERFSEDVDVLVRLPSGDDLMSAGQRHTALKYLCRGAENATGLEGEADGAKTSKGEKRAILLNYPELAEGSMAQLRPEGVLVELGRWGSSFPNERHELRSLVAEHATEVGAEEFEERDPIEASVVLPSRTAVEKLMLLHAAVEDDDVGYRSSVARHYYDLWCLLGHEATREHLEDRDFVASTAHDVLVHSEHAGLPSRERPLEGFTTSKAFDPQAEELKPVREVYETVVLGSLLWPAAANRPSFDDCCDRVRSVANGL